ncbi:uncharacterized protein LOC142578246 [Dermacentor variabilis]|uniref:uncharacterized protein LOC142578246 n=1 Tax=Dermacentor variabilis TaxID=34621 RepID=UPI003F5B5267
MESIILSDSPQHIGTIHWEKSWASQEIHHSGELPQPRGPQKEPPAVSGSGEQLLPEEDTSHAGCWLRYVSFVVPIAMAMSATLFTFPTILVARIGACQRGCFPLPKDLILSLNRNVHPCDDFYGHVCSGWDAEHGHRTPIDRYRITFTRRVINAILLENTPRRSTKAKGKAAGLLFRCLSQTEREGIDKMKTFLDDLGLPWPSKSSSSRPQLLNILVRASLEFGMPMFWAFYVGRHPSRTSENTIYMTLDPRCMAWISDIEALRVRGKEDAYLRRCAEVVGREGQSYSRMISGVLDIHFAIVDLVRSHWSESAIPAYNNLSDPDLRRAINGNLPDDAQIWPQDEVLNLQPNLFAQLDAMYLSKSEFQERFKLFLGAYVVWALSPMLSQYLTSSMLGYMNREVSKRDYRFLKCIEAIESLLPLVMWQLKQDAQQDTAPSWNIVRLSVHSVNSWIRTYGESTEQLANAITTKLASNAFNMTNTWDLLDDAYSYFPNSTAASFFDSYRRGAWATAKFFKNSLRQPEHSIYHVPGLAGLRQYQVLTAREVVVCPFLVSPPLYESWHPPPILAALAGTDTTGQILAVLKLFFYYNDRFEAYSEARLDQGARDMLASMRRFSELVKASDIMKNASLREKDDVCSASTAAHTASLMLDVMEQRHAPSAAGHHVAPTHGKTHRLYENERVFQRFRPEQIFFLLSCFYHCGNAGSRRQGKIGICNIALPASPRFRRAFKCSPERLLITNFTWPEPPEPTTAAP